MYATIVERRIEKSVSELLKILDEAGVDIHPIMVSHLTDLLDKLGLELCDPSEGEVIHNVLDE